ncbi:MAG: hypothetical protein ACFFDN_10730, partial [Candidatus Hodarchaeota archaeon]
MPLIVSIKNISIVTSGFFIILSNFVGDWPETQLFYVIMGVIVGIVALVLSVFVTRKGDSGDVDDLIVFNNMMYWLVVGIFLTLGSLFDDYLDIQLIFLNAGLIIGLFIMFMYVWIWLRKKWMFLDMQNVDFSSVDHSEIPKFLLTSLLLGFVFAGLFVIFQIIY